MPRHFRIYTDHKLLIKLLDVQHTTTATSAARIQRWFLYLSNFNYHVEYRKGCKNSNADTLTRLPVKYEISRKIIECLASSSLSDRVNPDPLKAM